jgi:hypothetical protein
VLEEEFDPEENLNVYYDSGEDRRIVYKPADVVRVVGGPEFDSDTSGTFLGYYYSCLLNTEDEILIRRGDCNNPDPLLRIRW